MLHSHPLPGPSPERVLIEGSDRRPVSMLALSGPVSNKLPLGAVELGRNIVYTYAYVVYTLPFHHQQLWHSS